MFASRSRASMQVVTLSRSTTSTLVCSPCFAMGAWHLPHSNIGPKQIGKLFQGNSLEPIEASSKTMSTAAQLGKLCGCFESNFWFPAWFVFTSPIFFHCFVITNNVPCFRIAIDCALGSLSDVTEMAHHCTRMSR